TIKNTLLLLFSLLMLSASCKKEKAKNPIDDLPPATQTGANTFGCLINGEIWKPKAGLLSRVLYYDYERYNNEDFLRISAIRVISDVNKMKLTIGIVGINKNGKYSVTDGNYNVNYSDTKSGCDYYDDKDLSGTLIITRYDLQAGIISGTFNFKLEKTGCPTIIATEGRFDLRK
ncbi:MAG: hypothetical protein EAZ51_05485, partial [Sphingobacteriales bacterium]